MANPPSSHICIIARGNAMNRTNHRLHAIIRQAWRHMPNLRAFVFFGGVQPDYGIIVGSRTTAAWQARHYLKTNMIRKQGNLKSYLTEDACGKLYTDDTFNSTSRCCDEIVRTYLWHNQPVVMVSDSLSILRIRWLLRYHVRQAGLQWAAVRPLVTFVHASPPLLGFRKLLMHEIGGWYNNLRDAYRAAPTDGLA